MKRRILVITAVVFVLFAMISVCLASYTKTDIIPPDGHVYWPTLEPPYAYTPTYTPKGWNLPIMPPTIGDELLTDLNCDGEVNIFDVSLAASALGTKIGDPMWKVEADVNLDGAVNIYDISSIAKDFGRRVVISPT